MKIVVDVYETDGITRVGEGPVMTCLSAKVKKTLDEAGSFNLDFPASDRRALELLQNERHVHIFVQEPSQSGSPELRELGRGVIRNKKKDARDGITLKVDGPDAMDALNRRTVRLNRQYANEQIGDIAADLVGLVPGWSVTVEDAVTTSLQSGRFAGASVLKALIRMVEEKGVHLRQSVSESNTVEIGVFGTQTGIVVTNTPNMTRALGRNDTLIVIDRLTEVATSKGIVNRVFPIGAGEGQAALTLKNSTRNTPYVIKSLVDDDGSTVYYLEDEDSIALYGVIEKVVTFKSIAPIANSETAKELAADALYDATVAWLQRNAWVQVTYDVSGVKARTQVQPGDQIRLRYKGEVYRDNMAISMIDVNDWFWVLGVTESANDNGVSIDLQISSIDQLPNDMTKTIVGKLEAVEVRNVSIQTFPITVPWMVYDTIKAPGLPAPFDYGAGYNRGKRARLDMLVTNKITDIIQVDLRIITFPLHVTSATYTVVNTYSYYDVVTSEEYPSGMRLRINDVDVTDDLGGPWNPGISDQLDLTVDITEYILSATGGIYQNHKIELECQSRTGDNSLGTPDPEHLGEVSKGYVFMIATGLCTTQALLPS